MCDIQKRILVLKLYFTLKQDPNFALQKKMNCNLFINASFDLGQRYKLIGLANCPNDSMSFRLFKLFMFLVLKCQINTNKFI